MSLREPEALFLTETPEVPDGIPKLPSGDLHLYRFPALTQFPENPFLKVLSAEEQSRAAGIRHPEVRATFIQGRARLRHLLAFHQGLRPEALTLTVGERGKPALFEGGIGFNVSHTRDQLLIGIARATDLGVDIESRRSLKHIERLIQNVFSPEERQRFDGRSEAEREDHFLRGWTLKEAYAKATGAGIAVGLQGIVIRADFKGFESLPEGHPSDFQSLEAFQDGCQIACVYRGPQRPIHGFRGVWDEGRT